MRYAGLFIALILTFAGSSAVAQQLGTPEERMEWFQRMEHEILLTRRTLLEREADLREPLWLVRSDGSFDVVDGAPIYERVTVAVELAVSLGAEEAAPSWLPDFARAEIAKQLENAAAGRAGDVRDSVIEAYRAHSRSVRARALEEIRGDLETVRDGFAQAMAESDRGEGAGANGSGQTAADGDGWRARMAERGASLPAGVTLIDPKPQMDRNCRAPAETPIWILVSDGSRCSGSWKHRGSGKHEGRAGDWCVWCPAKMYWRSGWGCCFPE